MHLQTNKFDCIYQTLDEEPLKTSVIYIYIYYLYSYVHEVQHNIDKLKQIHINAMDRKITRKTKH